MVMAMAPVAGLQGQDQAPEVVDPAVVNAVADDIAEAIQAVIDQAARDGVVPSETAIQQAIQTVIANSALGPQGVAQALNQARQTVAANNPTLAATNPAAAAAVSNAITTVQRQNPVTTTDAGTTATSPSGPTNPSTNPIAPNTPGGSGGTTLPPDDDDPEYPDNT